MLRRAGEAPTTVWSILWSGMRSGGCGSVVPPERYSLEVRRRVADAAARRRARRPTLPGAPGEATNLAGSWCVDVDTSWGTAPTETELRTGHVHVWLVRLDSSIEDAYDARVAFSDAEARRATRFLFAHHRTGYVRAHFVLRRLLAQYLGAVPHAVRLSRSEAGKPRLASHSGLSFNMSRTSDVALYGFSRDGEIGVDIEQVRSDIDTQSLANQFFTTSESTTIAGAGPDERIRLFFTAWVRKEAVLKAEGGGLSAGLSAVDVAPQNAESLLTVPLCGSTRSFWHVVTLPPWHGHLAALATRRPPSRVRCFLG